MNAFLGTEIVKVLLSLVQEVFSRLRRQLGMYWQDWLMVIVEISHELVCPLPLSSKPFSKLWSGTSTILKMSISNLKNMEATLP